MDGPVVSEPDLLDRSDRLYRVAEPGKFLSDLQARSFVGPLFGFCEAGIARCGALLADDFSFGRDFCGGMPKAVT